MASTGKIYKIKAFPLSANKERSDELSVLCKTMKNWGEYLDYYARVCQNLFDGGESVFEKGAEPMCMASLATAIHRSDKKALTAVELPDKKSANPSGGGRVDLWAYTNDYQFNIEGKLNRKNIGLEELEKVFVGKGKGSATGLISKGFRDFQKSTGTRKLKRIRKTNSQGIYRIMLLMARVSVDEENSLTNFEDKLRGIFESDEHIDVYRNSISRSGATCVPTKMGSYEHAALVVVPDGTGGIGFVAVASILQRPRQE